jgi:hypothetical protein
VNLSFYNAATGVARGTISHLQIITGSDVGCTFVIDGTGATADDGQVASRGGCPGQLPLSWPRVKLNLKSGWGPELSR